MRQLILPMPVAALLLLPPGLATADNECGLQQPVVAETLECAPGDYTNGIHYTADGDLQLVVPAGASDLNLNAGGARVTATGDDALTWDASAFTGVTRGNGGVVIDYQSEMGDIDIHTNRITGSAGATHGIRAISQAGDIRVRADGQLSSLGTAIEAVTGSGNILLELNGIISGPVTANTQGGDGTLQADVRASVNALSLTSGTGLLTLNLQEGGNVIRLDVDAGGDAVINHWAGKALRPQSGPTFAFLSAAEGTVTTFNVFSPLVAKTNLQPYVGSVRPFIRGEGAGAYVLNNRSLMNSGFDFSASTGGVVFDNQGSDANAEGTAWIFSDTVNFSAGDDRIHNRAGATLISSFPTVYKIYFDGFPSEVVSSELRFHGGDDEILNEGVVVIGNGHFQQLVGLQGPPLVDSEARAFHTTFDALEHFDNQGLIIFGAWLQADPVINLGVSDPICQQLSTRTLSCREALGVRDTDAEPSTVLSMPGTHFTGGAGSTLLMDVMLGRGQPQRDCVQRSGANTFFRLPGADCLDLRDGSTEGQTQVVLRDREANDLGAYNPEGIVIVDVSGGDTAAGHFVLSPDSDGYDAKMGAIDKGLFVFPLMYDEQHQQHKLVGLPGARALQMPLLVQGALGLSRRAGEVWFQRNQDLRQSVAGDAGGAWARVTTTRGSRDVQQDISAYGQTLSTRNDFDQDDTLITLGRDLIAGDSGWVVGGSIGYARSQLNFASTGADADFDGITLGLHARYQQGAFHLDNQLLGSWLQADYEDGAFSNADDPYDALETETQGLGARLEAGWRFDLGETLYLQPLASASWERTEFDRLTILVSGDSARPTNEIFGDHTPTSLRTALGARVGLDQPLGTLRLSMMLTGRLWNELRGETPVRIRSAGPDLVVDDTFDSALSEIALGVGLGNAGGTVSGHLQVDGTFGDDYDSFGMTAGFRYQW